MTEQYHAWKANTPKLYQHLHTHNTIWPSLQVQYLNDINLTNGLETVRLLTTVHSSGQKESDFVRISSYVTNSINSTSTNDNNSISISNTIGSNDDTVKASTDLNSKLTYNTTLNEYTTTTKPTNKLSTLQNLRVPTTQGDINSISAMPQNQDIIALGMSNGKVFIVDKTKHASNLDEDTTTDGSAAGLFFDVELDTSDSNVTDDVEVLDVDNNTNVLDLDTSTTTQEITSLAWNPSVKGQILVASTSGVVFLFDVNDYVSSDVKIKAKAVFLSNNESNTKSDVGKGVNVVRWIEGHDSLFVSGNEDNSVQLFDTRVITNSTDKPKDGSNSNIPKAKSLQTSSIHHNKGINALIVTPQNPFLLATGDGEGVINIWDIRDLTSPILSLGQVHDGAVTCLEFQPLYQKEVKDKDASQEHGLLLASGGEDSMVQIYDLSLDDNTDGTIKISTITTKPNQTEGEVENEEEIQQIQLRDSPYLIFRHAGHRFGINDIAWDIHHRGVIASVGNDNTLQIWRGVGI